MVADRADIRHQGGECYNQMIEIEGEASLVKAQAMSPQLIY